MITTALFDFDGTLANTNQLIINSFKHIYSEFCNSEGDEEYIVSTFGEPLNTTLARDFGEYNLEDVLSKYKEYQMDKFYDEVFLYDTVPETLEFLKNKGIEMGVVTSRMKNSTMEALEKFNIIKYFDIIVAADDVKRHKPHKEPLIKAINELKTSVDKTVYVGDSKFDMECAINAETTPVLVGWQSNSKILAQKYNVQHVLDKMWDLTKLL